MSQAQTTPEVIAQALRDAATSPASASNETGSMSTRPIADLIALDRYLAAKAAASRRDRGLRIQRFQPPGTV